jgi:hypothetical protein
MMYLPLMNPIKILTMTIRMMNLMMNLKRSRSAEILLRLKSAVITVALVIRQ